LTSVPCTQNADLKPLIEAVAESLRTTAHILGDHGLTEEDFYSSGVFRGAIERLRGQFSAAMSEKREFVRHVLNFMQDGGFIADWDSAGESNRHDYLVVLNDGRKSAIELKGCLDGNNTNIFERPPHANEFILWSVCTNQGADPQRNVWSGLHTRLSAEIIDKGQQVDGLVVWDYVCGSLARPCPKLKAGYKTTKVASHALPPPCLYLFPSTVPSPRNNPKPTPHQLADVGILAAFHEAFGQGSDEYVNSVEIEVMHQGSETARSTAVFRGGELAKKSPRPTTIKRS